ncbi:MAG: type III secretion system export apparatus subunit SctS [Methylacidiphilaceae bacterium]|nr:type III secretion system export apparatus subunit SctS [Candidatus Methylacidiphilaceae bacterium]
MAALFALINQTALVDYTSRALLLVLLLSLPPVGVATVVGLAVSLLQALTQIQDQTLPFGLKLVAVIFALLLAGTFLGGEVVNFLKIILESFPTLIQ